ncbi:MAG TPA: DNA-directed RNA polymerase subunit alpha C-terminal domain-containing protein [Planctomycetota bacterium]|nr:DNA-directed RNA polymerase subunit alpha C-terminal domain-containing protein [Planctomycetota bacterium]
MPTAEETLDLSTLIASEDVAPAQFAEARRQIHCSIERRSALEKLLEDFPAVAKKLSSENKADTRKAAILWALGRVEEAIPLFEAARASREKAYLLGLSYLDVGKSEPAIAQLKEALEADTSDASAAAGLAEAYVRSGDYDSAEKVLERHLKKNPDHGDLLYVQGLSLDFQGYHDEAVQKYERALEKEPGHPRALFRLAYLYDLGGEDDRALELYEQLRRQRPIHVNTMINLGIFYEDRNEFEKAADCFRSVLEYFPNHPRARLYLRDAEASLSMFYDEEAARREARMAQVLGLPLADVTFSQRVRNALQKLGLATLGDLVTRTEEELLEIPNFGKTSLREVKEFLTSKGLNLASGGEIAAPAGGEVVEGEAQDEAKNRALADFEWSGRIRKVFEKLGVVTVGDLLNHTEADLLKSKNLGSTSIKEIRQKLGTLGAAMRAE